MNIRVPELDDQLFPEYNTSFGKQEGIDRLKMLGGEVDISEISSEVELHDSGSSLDFHYHGLLIG